MMFAGKRKYLLGVFGRFRLGGSESVLGAPRASCAGDSRCQHLDYTPEGLIGLRHAEAAWRSTGQANVLHGRRRGGAKLAAHKQ